MANFIDKAIGYLNPKAGARRLAYRKQMELLDQVRGYDGASAGRLAHGWRTASSTADSEIGKAGQRLRDRSRDLVRNNPLAAKIVTSHANNFVGFGITPRAVTGKPELDKQINELFDEWSRVCVSGTREDFYAVTHKLARMMVQDGEVYLRRRQRRPEDGLPVPLQLQVLDAEYCDWSKNGASPAHPANRIVQGVEFDALGNRSGYWMYSENPHSSTGWLKPDKTSSFVYAEDIVHIYEPQTNQVHGVPWLAPVITELRDLKDYELSENIRKKVEACMVGVVIPGDGDAGDPNVGLDETLSTSDRASVTDINGFPFERMEPGMFGVLHGGKDIKFNTPAISAGVEAYIRTRHRSIAAGARLPYEIMTGDFSQSNFASGKLGLLEYKRFVEIVQWHYIIQPGLNVIWEWFVTAAKLAGKIPANIKVGVEWTAPEFESITRLDDARADLLEIRMGKRSPQEIIAKTGRDPMSVLKEIDEWNQAVDGTVSKVILDGDPRKVAINGQIQHTLTGEDPDNGEGNA